MGSAAQSFRYARLRRSRPAASDTIDSANAISNSSKADDDQLNDVAEAPRRTSAVQPLVVAGLAPTDHKTVTTVAGASVAPLQLTERPAGEKVPAGPPVFLERRSRPRNGISVRSLNVAIALVALVALSPLML